MTCLSLPMRGEWIEIAAFRRQQAQQYRLSPCGESGLKSCPYQDQRARVQSLPMRGEWIEIHREIASGLHPTSLPMRGEWIEISAGATSVSP